MTLAQLPGYFTAAYFIERYGRKFVLVVYLTLTAVSAIAFGLATTEAAILTAGICLSFFNLGHGAVCTRIVRNYIQIRFVRQVWALLHRWAASGRTCSIDGRHAGSARGGH